MRYWEEMDVVETAAAMAARKAVSNALFSRSPGLNKALKAKE